MLSINNRLWVWTIYDLLMMGQLIINEAMKEQEEQYDEDEDDADDGDDDGNDDDQVFLEESFLKPALPRTRNRPRREV